MTEDAQDSVPSLSDSAKDFLKEEHKYRRQEIENLIARLESDQKNGLIFTGAIWAWLATNISKVDSDLSNVIVILPPLIMSFFLYRRYHVDKMITTIAVYTRELERILGVPEKYGWEGWLHKRRHEGDNVDPLAGQTFWILLILVNCIPAFLITLHWLRVSPS
jgi:hypothetical protein